MAGELHQKLLACVLKDLEEKGFRTVDLTGVIPDGIAIKNGKIYAVEILVIKGIAHNNLNHQCVKQKRNKYKMFDDIIFKVSNKRIFENPEVKKYAPELEKECFEEQDCLQKQKEDKADFIVREFFDNYKTH